MNADCIVIQGSNMAECHPVGFQWVVEARARGAKVFHVDPRFTRTSALAHRHIPIRAGTDIVLLGALINHVLTNELDFREYVLAYTNASTIVSGRFRDTEDLDGLFSGFDPERRKYDPSSWSYEGSAEEEAEGEDLEGGHRHAEAAGPHQYGSGGPPASATPPTDPTLRHPRCVYQIVKRHFARYTPELVEELCGIPPEAFAELADAITANSGRERTTAWVYSVGWTQHTVGVQYIRTAAILQLLLGNMGRPGGGILALRGHASIQGSTDIPTLFNLLPGYLPMPHAHLHEGLDDYLAGVGSGTGFWGNRRSYMVSLLKTWWGEAATGDNDFCFGHLPRITGDHGHYTTVMGQIDGTVKGYFVVGENPAVGSSGGKAQRLGLANLDWLVVRDLTLVETATFWKDGPELETGEMRTEDIATEVFFLPAASHVEKEGTFTNTQRLLQWREKALDPPGDCRSELWFYHHLGKRIRQRLSGDEIDRPLRELTWDYPEHGEHAEPSAEAVLREINGTGPDGRALSSYTELRDDGSTRCGCWIYCGVYAEEVNQAARRRPGREQSLVAPEWGWAWPANRRILYNRASADPEGRPWSERKAYVWWDAERRRWTGHDVPDFEPGKPPDYLPPDGALAQAALAGTDPFIMQSDGKGWLFAPAGLADGPLPTHYESHESPVRSTLYGRQANPTRKVYDRPESPYNPPGSPRFPYVLTTYRLTEHHTAGGMSRTLAYLSELQPELFCEVSPALAAELGLVNGGWATIVTTRTAIEARVLVTERLRPLRVQGRTVHQIGLPYHWGGHGLVTGDVVNDLLPLALDPNVYIQEGKATTCDLRPGRRPTGRALLDLIEEYRHG
ncbi:formate dehydrogenase major subunit [Streptosporangium becharense]|uniref:Formate dehydrogenase major subunit n=1 Tax=Streptosporangium becharense TaxID=1816182 RepID=A0A7W9IM95_9ACTN|nr:formate dehydrogenase major subunit [Streptosporangium becharense]MBB5823201.1 formate dehydrogenase major subunit [Streptosporangium becharense]